MEKKQKKTIQMQTCAYTLIAKALRNLCHVVLTTGSVMAYKLSTLSLYAIKYNERAIVIT